jgi:tRNA nucleotidyltransferase (CCA-adding enzyme)
MRNLLSNLNSKSLNFVRSIGLLAEECGMTAYLVGGPVRDLMLKLPNVDLDITVETPYKLSADKGTGNIGNAMRLADVFAGGQAGSKVTKYPAFKTATVLLSDGTLIDFATARSETYVRGGAFPAVKPSRIKDDLFRRDFTINAMAVEINPKSWGKLVDPFKGRVDLTAKKIRVLHEKSFLDDPTRILRAARFKARLGFSIEAKTLKLLKSAIKIKVLETIKPQRYLKDFEKIKKEPKSLEAIKCLKSWNAYK